MCMYVQLHERAYGSQKVLDPMKLEIQAIASHYVGDNASMQASDFKQGAISFAPVLLFFKKRQILL